MTYTPSLKKEFGLLLPVSIIGATITVILLVTGKEYWYVFGTILGAPIGLYLQYLSKPPALLSFSEEGLTIRRPKGREDKVTWEIIRSAKIFTRSQHVRIYLKTATEEIYFRLLGFSQKEAREIVQILSQKLADSDKPVLINGKAEQALPANDLHAPTS